jgi:5-methyltetrahydrofolate--homocysteine methyltransferase
MAGDYAAAVEVARQQVENGAQIIDVNMDEGLLDAEAAMVTFLKLIAAEPDIARVPIMIDSSKWSVIEAGLKCVSGQADRQLDQHEGGRGGVPRPRPQGPRYGAAVVVMAFDETGQADTLQRKVEICQRAYRLLVAEGFPPEDIIFDPNIFAVATGIEEHRRYALDFIEACREIKARCPHVHLSGGLSNLSFSFRGNEPVRRAMHSVFLYHAIPAGLDMAIVNAGQLDVYDTIDPELREACEDVILDRRDDATERLVTLAEKYLGSGRPARRPRPNGAAGPVGKRLSMRWSRASTPISSRTPRRRGRPVRAADRGDRRPADGRHERGRRPVRLGQDVPAAGGEVGPRDEEGGRPPHPVHRGREGEAGASTAKGRIVMATVKGDVHDIGKNIVGVVLQCNGFEVIDLGVMVPWQDILKAANENQADMIGLSGLITPSLDEMVTVAGEMQREKLTLPLLIGGATTSKVHTALRIDPAYEGPVIHVLDASRAVGVASSLVSDTQREPLIERTSPRIRPDPGDPRRRGQSELATLAEARANAFPYDPDGKAPPPQLIPACTSFGDWPLRELRDSIDWTPFFRAWELAGNYPAILDRPGRRRERLQPVRRRPGDARPDRSPSIG